jgi:hypothetical protein
MELKFRGLDGEGVWHYGNLLQSKPFKDGGIECWIQPKSLLCLGAISTPTSSFVKVIEKTVEQSVGLTDINGIEFYVGSVGEFENGDRFVLKMEDWLEIYVDWIGDAECEDQARDLYRIRSAKIIGNSHQHRELLESKQ